MSRTQGAVGKKPAKNVVYGFRCTEEEAAEIKVMVAAIGCRDLREYLLLRIAISKEKNW